MSDRAFEPSFNCSDLSVKLSSRNWQHHLQFQLRVAKIVCTTQSSTRDLRGDIKSTFSFKVSERAKLLKTEWPIHYTANFNGLVFTVILTLCRNHFLPHDPMAYLVYLYSTLFKSTNTGRQKFCQLANTPTPRFPGFLDAQNHIDTVFTSPSAHPCPHLLKLSSPRCFQAQQLSSFPPSTNHATNTYLTASITGFVLQPTLKAALHLLNADLLNAHFLVPHMQAPPAVEWCCCIQFCTIGSDKWGV